MRMYARLTTAEALVLEILDKRLWAGIAGFGDHKHRCGAHVD